MPSEQFPFSKKILGSSYEELLDATIMIVDDEPSTIGVVQAFLEEAGYCRFVTVSDSPTAMEVMERERPDILLLDLMMPEVSGFDILAAVRAHPKFERLPVIILTAYSDSVNKLRALDLGATDFLAKPVDPSELGLRVRNTLAAKAYLDHLTFYDRLTGLPNRYRFFEQFDLDLQAARRFGDRLALLNIELDTFDRIRDTVGVAAADEVLRQVSARIVRAVRGCDVLARTPSGFSEESGLYRIEGGVFSLILYRIESAEAAALVADRLVQAIREPLQVEGSDHFVKASIGIAVYPDEATSGEELLRLASSAKDYIRREGGDCFLFSSPAINTAYQRRRQIEAQLRRALADDEFSLCYQPKVDLNSGEIVGVEALLRWQRGEQGTVEPEEFIPVAEETGLIVPLGEWILRHALAQLGAWQAAGWKKLGLSLNLSARQFLEQDFAVLVQRAVDRSGVAPELLTLEITENLLLQRVDDKIKVLERFKEMGLRLAIDDFGTGYASMTGLGRLPLDELKIDRSFIQKLPEPTSGVIVSSIIFLAQRLGLRTVAEGVETREQLEFLEDRLCNTYQGYLHSRPLASSEVEAMLAGPKKGRAG